MYNKVPIVYSHALSVIHSRQSKMYKLYKKVAILVHNIIHSKYIGYITSDRGIAAMYIDVYVA